MSITDEGSVLIIGAGASVDFGMPLGGELIDFLSHKILTKDWWNKPNSFDSGYKSFPPEAIRFKGELPAGAKNDAFAALAWRDNNKSDPKISGNYETNSKKAIELAELLNGQTSETIDDFIALNPSFANLSKLFIASDFANRLYKWNSNFHEFRLKDISRRYLNRTPIRWNDDRQTFEEKKDKDEQVIVYRERNWIHLLINIVRHKIQKDSDLSEKIKIISFNYDGILEKVLSDQFMNTEMLLKLQEEQGKSYTDFFDIVHPHGCCGKLEERPQDNNPWKLANQWSDEISVVNEAGISVPPRVSLARSEAKTWIKEARHIYAAGFAFSKPNCDSVLDLESNMNCQISYLNFDDDIGLDLAVKNAVNPKVWKNRDHPVTPKIIKASGTPSRPLSIANWIKTGHLGEMPG